LKILVNATALDSRGAFSVVNSFLYEMNTSSQYLLDKGIKLHFLVAKKELCRYENEVIKVDYESFPKKGLYHKWKYERIILPELVRKGVFGAYLSLQNFVLKKISIKQFALIHQPIPFAELKLSELEIKNWIKYKLLFGWLLFRQKNDINGVIVQTNWMREAIIKKYNYKCPIVVIRPSVEDVINNTGPLSVKVQEYLSLDGLKIFYPTNQEKYKNNEKLIESIIKYNKTFTKKIILYITLEGSSNEYVKYIGKIPYESIYSLYKSIDAIVFPSLAETLGLPLLEAKMNGIPVIVSDLPYAREICGDFAYYFNPRCIDSIIQAIDLFVNNKLNAKLIENILTSPNRSYMDYINFILSLMADKG
jgi:glycosyltransferase involved in cell wall biosynthesis